MEYNIRKLAEEYIKYIEKYERDITTHHSTYHDYSTYNEYKYRKMMQEYDNLYKHTDSTNLTERFLKGD